MTTAATHTWGFIGPTASGGSSLQSVQPERLLPPNVVQLTTGIGITDYTKAGVAEAMTRYWGCAEAMVRQGAQSLILGGVPISSQLGRPAVLDLIAETQRRTGVPGDSSNEAIIAGLQRLGVRRLAVASRWAAQLNQALVEYFAHAGITVVAITSEGQWAREAFSMSLERGIVLAVRLGRAAMRHAPDAQALLLPGGTWRALTAVPLLEEDFGVPVLTNGIATAWRLISRGIAPTVQGWGRLLADP